MSMVTVSAVDEQSSGLYRKNRDKIIKVLRECKGFIRLPPEYAGAMNWEAMENNLKTKLPKYKEKLPEVVKKCTTALSQAPGQDYDYYYCKRGIMNCVDYIGSMMKYPGIQIGIYQGMLDEVLKADYYRQYLPGICYKIAQLLNE